MPKKPKISTEEKISAVESYLHGELSHRQAAQKVGVKVASYLSCGGAGRTSASYNRAEV